MIRDNLLKIMPSPIKELMMQIPAHDFENIQEIRLRVHKPILIVFNNEEYGLSTKGLCSQKESYAIEDKDLSGLLKFISGFSLYAVEEELKEGYMTLEGGHRIGLVGKVVLDEKGIKTMKYISGMNIRISHEVIGCSRKVMPYLLSREGVRHTLIVSPPKCGKTTLLRDIIRNLSYGYSGYGPYTVGVVDERSEIAGCYRGVPQNDVGPRTDVLDGCPKVRGMSMLLRAMAPDIIAVDEIGSLKDAQAIEEVLTAGVSIVCTTHGKNLEDCYHKKGMQQMIENKLFETIIVLSNRQGVCTIEEILNTQQILKKVANL